MSQIVHLVYNYNCTPTHRVSLCSMSHIEQLQLYSHTQSVPLLHVTHRTTTTVLPHTECPSAPCHTLYSYNCTPTHSVSLLHVTHCTATIVLPHTECPSAPCHTLNNYNCTPTHSVPLLHVTHCTATTVLPHTVFLCSMSHIVQLQLYSHTQSVSLLHVTHCTATIVLPHTECPSAPCHTLNNYNCTPTHRVSLCSMSHIEQLQLYSHTQSVPLLHVTHCTATIVLPHTECFSAPCHTLYSYNCTPTHRVFLCSMSHIVQLQLYSHTQSVPLLQVMTPAARPPRSRQCCHLRHITVRSHRC